MITNVQATFSLCVALIGICLYFIRCCPTRRSDERLFNILLDRLDDIEAQIKDDSQTPEPEDESPAEELHFTKQDVLIDGAVERSME
jgi:hypothetical protein